MCHPTAPWRFHDKSEPVIKAASKLLLNGRAQKVGHIVEAAGLPYCDSPVPVSVASPRGTGGLEVQMFGPCRKCEKCLQYRALHWRDRAMNEIAMAHLRGRRTWMVTLTFSPPHLAGILAEASVAGDRSLKGVDRMAYRHVRGYLDRVRKAGFPFRYLAVFERGERTGRAHYHLLLHEGREGPILKRTLETRWRSHVHARVIDMDGDGAQRKAAAYVSKYATKAAEIRIRASARYGQPLGGSV